MGRIPALLSFTFRQRFNCRGNQGGLFGRHKELLGAGDPKKVREGFLEKAQPKHMLRMQRVGQANRS